MTVWVLPSAVMVSPLGKLSLYHVAVKAVFIQYVCSQASETVGRCYALIAHSAHQVRQSVFTQYARQGLLPMGTDNGYVLSVPSVLPKVQASNRQGGDDMRGFHLHLGGGYAPLCPV